MKIFIVCSKSAYGKVAEIKKEMKILGHNLTLPNSYNEPTKEFQMKDLGKTEHAKWKSGMLEKSRNIISNMDGILVLNFDKSEYKNYIGGATFIEMYDAHKMGKKIFLYNDIPEGILYDEICGFSPIVLNGDLRKVG